MLSKAISKCRLLADLSIEEKQLFSKQLYQSHHSKGELIFEEKPQAEKGFYVVESGMIRLSKSGKTLGLIGEGSYFGDYSAIDGKECVTSAHAEDDCTILCSTDGGIWSFLESNPKIATKLYRASLCGAFSRLRELE